MTPQELLGRPLVGPGSGAMGLQKRPFCNAFTGCAGKRAPFALPSGDKQRLRFFRKFNTIDNSVGPATGAKSSRVDLFVVTFGGSPVVVVRRVQNFVKIYRRIVNLIDGWLRPGTAPQDSDEYVADNTNYDRELLQE